MEYQVIVAFKADRALTQDELASLQDTIALQVVEPADLNGQEAGYQTTDIDIKMDAMIEREG